MSQESPGRIYATFHLAGLRFAIDVAQVQEVLREQEMTPVPLAHPAIRGLINLRGQVVTAIDMRKRLGLAPFVPGGPCMNVIVDFHGEPVSLLVDGVGDVMELADAAFEPSPPTLDGPLRALTSGLYKLSDGLCLVLATEKVLELA